MVDLRKDAAVAKMSLSALVREALFARHGSKGPLEKSWPCGYFQSIKPLEFEAPADLPSSQDNPID